MRVLVTVVVALECERRHPVRASEDNEAPEMERAHARELRHHRGARPLEKRKELLRAICGDVGDDGEGALFDH